MNIQEEETNCCYLNKYFELILWGRCDFNLQIKIKLKKKIWHLTIIIFQLRSPLYLLMLSTFELFRM